MKKIKKFLKKIYKKKFLTKKNKKKLKIEKKF